MSCLACLAKLREHRARGSCKALNEIWCYRCLVSLIDLVLFDYELDVFDLFYFHTISTQTVR